MIVRARDIGTLDERLTAGALYVVIGMEADHYRLLNDRGEPCLYGPEQFEIVNAEEPADWVVEVGEDGERYAYPPALNAVGFFEDYFDGDADAQATFWHTVNRHLAETA
jgi:hypothetical protein